MTTILSFFKSLLFALMAFIFPIQGIMIFVGLSIFIDTGFGIWASKRNKKPILSSKLFRLATKMVTYQSAVILFYGIDLYMFGDLLAAFGIGIPFLLTKLIGLSLIGIEAFSVDEKLKSVNPGKGIFYHFKRLVGALKIVKSEWEDLDIKKDSENEQDNI